MSVEAGDSARAEELGMRYMLGGAIAIGGFYYLAKYHLPQSVTVALLAILAPYLLHRVRRFIREGNEPLPRALIVLTNDSAGYDGVEARAAFDAFEEEGVQAVWASPLGGRAPSADPMLGNEGDEETLPLARCPARDFIALYCVGGPGALNLRGCNELRERAAEVLQAEGAVGTCGTGVSGLEAAIRDSDKHGGVIYVKGEYLDREGRKSAARIVVGQTADAAKAVARAVARKAKAASRPTES